MRAAECITVSSQTERNRRCERRCDRLLADRSRSPHALSALAACGDSDAATAAAAASAGIPRGVRGADRGARRRQKGGDLTVLAAGDIDYMDPGAAYYQFTYMVDDATQRRCCRWPPDDVKEPTPDLAEEQPEVSEDGKTITFTISDGVKFSPPVDREVNAADFKYAIERSLLPGVANGYMAIYLGDLDGYRRGRRRRPRRTRPAARRTSSGITAPDDQTLVIKLTQPTRRPGHPGAVAADQRTGAGGVREGVRRREPVDLRRARRLHRPVHGRERRRRASSPATPPARRSRWSATRTGTRTPTTGRRTSTRSQSRRASPTPTRRRARSSTGDSQVNGDILPRRGAQAGRDGSSPTGPDVAARAAATATSR